MHLTALEASIITGGISAILGGAIAVLSDVISARRSRRAARDDRTVDAIEIEINAVMRRIRESRYKISEAEQDQLLYALHENLEKISVKKVRGRLRDVIQVLSWAFVVAPDEAIWPAFYAIEQELRSLLGAYVREDARLPKPALPFQNLVSSANIVGDIPVLSPEQLAAIEEELSDVYGPDWKEHADELLRDGGEEASAD